jgi:rhodanese-related sulfurtransferase
MGGDDSRFGLDSRPLTPQNAPAFFLSKPQMTSYKNLTVIELQALLDAPRRIQLVDVRTDSEVAQGYLHTAQKIPLSSLPLRLAELDAAAPTVFYCHIGGRSAQAAMFASGRGFTEVYHLQGGMVAWLAAAAPVVLA